jgi:hypothetical protein
LPPSGCLGDRILEIESLKSNRCVTHCNNYPFQIFFLTFCGFWGVLVVGPAGAGISRNLCWAPRGVPAGGGFFVVPHHNQPAPTPIARNDSTSAAPRRMLAYAGTANAGALRDAIQAGVALNNERAVCAIESRPKVAAYGEEPQCLVDAIPGMRSGLGSTFVLVAAWGRLRIHALAHDSGCWRSR